MSRLVLTILLTSLALTVYAMRSSLETSWQLLRFANSLEITELTSEKYISDIYSNSVFDATVKSGTWFNKNLNVPTSLISLEISDSRLSSSVLGQSAGEKWIDINLDTQTLTAFEATNPVYSFKISSGLPWMPTVTGEFRIWAKVKSQRMSGGSKENGTYYDLPNVPFVQYFHGGYGIHGAYWHNDFGKPRSHGCVNMSISDAKKLFEWTTPTLTAGTWNIYKISPEESVRVVVHGKATL